MKALIYTFIILLFVPFCAIGQGWVSEENTFETNWNVTVQVGQGALLGEFMTDFSTTVDDMNNQADWAFSFQLGKMIWEQLDIGFEYSIANFKGYRHNPSQVHYLMSHPTYNNATKDFQPFSIYYDSDITNIGVYAKYNFINFRTFSQGYLDLNVYGKITLGLLFPSAILGYKDPANYDFTDLTHPLYLKGRYPNPRKDSHVLFSPAIGLNYQISERIFLSLESSAQILTADYIDGVHNYSAGLTPETPVDEISQYRIQVWSITAKGMIGLTYFFNFDTHKKDREKNQPWRQNTYRSYYSKYHKASSKKKQNKRTPFYNEKNKKKTK